MGRNLKNDLYVCIDQLKAVPTEPPFARLASTHSAIETCPYQIQVDFVNADQASITANSLIIADGDCNPLPLSLDSVVPLTNGEIGYTATFTVDCSSDPDDFLTLTVPESGATNNLGVTDETCLAVQEVQPVYPQLISTTPAVYPLATEARAKWASVSFSFTAAAGDMPGAARTPYEDNTGKYSTFPARQNGPYRVVFDVDAGEIQYLIREHSDSTDWTVQTTPFNFVVGTNYDIEVRFRSQVVDTYVGGVLVASLRDSRFGHSSAFGAIDPPANGFVNYELHRIQPEPDLDWGGVKPFKFERCGDVPELVGGTRGLLSRFLGFKILDMTTTTLTGYPARYAIFASDDHAPANATTDIKRAWANNLDLSDLTDFEVVISDPQQVETPYPIWDAANNRVVLITHSTFSPISNRQSTISYVSTDPLMATWTGKQAALPADGATLTNREVTHTGYLQPYEVSPGVWHGVSLGQNGVDGSEQDARPAYRGWLQSSSADIRNWTRDEWVWHLNNDDHEMSSPSVMNFFEVDGNTFALGALLNFEDDWNPGSINASNTANVMRVSDDLSVWGRRSDLMIKNPRPYEYNQRPFSIFIDDAGVMWVYMAGSEFLGNPAITGNNSVTTLSVYKMDPVNNSFTASPMEDYLLWEDWGVNGAVNGTAAGDVVPNGANWQVDFGAVGVSSVTKTGGALTRGTGSLLDNAVVTTSYPAGPGIRISTKFRDFTSGTNAGIVFDYVDPNNFKVWDILDTGEQRYREYVAGVSNIITTVPADASMTTIDAAIITVELTSTEARFYRGGVLTPRLVVPGDFSAANRAGVIMRRRDQLNDWFFIEEI